jgi:hypothetical protein
MARRPIEEQLQQAGDDPTLARADEILGETLHQGPWGEVA